MIQNLSTINFEEWVDQVYLMYATDFFYFFLLCKKVIS